jgi:hypothetical protein
MLYTADDIDVLKKEGAAIFEEYDDLDACIAKHTTKNPALPAAGINSTL